MFKSILREISLCYFRADTASRRHSTWVFSAFPQGEPGNKIHGFSLLLILEPGRLEQAGTYPVRMNPNIWEKKNKRRVGIGNER